MRLTVVQVICGGLGSGKNLTALHLMRCAVAAGRPCFTDINLTPACPFQNKVVRIGTERFPICDPEAKGEYQYFWQYLCDIPRAYIVIDEADMYFNSSDYKYFERDIQGYHKHARKLQQDIVYIVQNPENLYVRIRKIAQRYVVCQHTYRTVPVFRHLRRLLGESVALWASRFVKSEFEDANFRTHHADGYFSYREASQMFPWYDTNQINPEVMEIIRGTKVHGFEVGDERAVKRKKLAAVKRRRESVSNANGGYVGVAGVDGESAGGG